MRPLAQLLDQRVVTGRSLPGVGRPAQVAGGDRARPVHLRLGFRRRTRDGLDCERAGPVSRLEIDEDGQLRAVIGEQSRHVVIRRHSGHGLVMRDRGIRILDDRPRLRFLSALKVGVDQEIVRVKLVHPAALMPGLGRSRGLHEAEFASMSSLQRPSLAKICPGMCTACGPDGATLP